MAEASASLGELERELAGALGKQDLPMSVSLINSILHKLGNNKHPEGKTRRLQLLHKKLELLTQL